MFEIPAGARHVQIEEMEPSPHTIGKNMGLGEPRVSLAKHYLSKKAFNSLMPKKNLQQVAAVHLV